ncbi:UDP:flavonoid glycosyltransferase YjiC, YdhE family [Clostridium cavendishii DSM 21758]|uniref:UDP:flavonoid glycosyltransferase YjiC, YdhE family n=1 Tax=Clostridium cavendishii DSM 21758 TaxID=1121302 RepID=A0A1M6N7B9_9CLOT|nr:nucleotide disphospho-sugar-binding domain-containing protein [Clostridium cavendishii]SHJ91609.1 UDP:flavonoid glycosyltransferase YjiC, YdhE family [Clostridium cavendishii DSM 21758]
MSNILLITHGTGGDVKPFIKLGKIIKNIGHDVLLLTHCIYEKEAKINGLDFVAIDTYEEYKEKNSKLNNLSDAIKDLNEYTEFNRKYCGADRTYKEYKIISEHCKKENTIIIFRHRFSLAGLLVAEKYGLSVASVFLAPNYIQHLKLHEELIGKVMKNEMNIIRNKIGLTDISNWTKWMCSPNLKIGLWPKWYAKEESENISGMVVIGFPEKMEKNTDEIPKEIKEFLKTGKKTALITAGTSNAINPNFYKIAADSCKCSDINGILVTDIEEFVPKDLSSNILRLHEAPIRRILPYVNVVIHHGGIGTSSEALACGTPQLIMAHLADRPDNANRLKKVGVAKVFPEIKWKPEIIGQGLKEIIYNEVLASSCKKLSEDLNKNNIEEELSLLIEELSKNKEKYKVNILCDLNDEDFNNDNEKVSDKASLDSISERKKRIILQLLREKRKF